MELHCVACATTTAVAEASLVRGDASCRRCGAALQLPLRAAAGAEHTVVTGPPPQMSPLRWYVTVDGEVEGPLPEDEVVRLFHEGSITARTPCWHEGMKRWRRLADVHDFAVLFTPRRRLLDKAERAPSESSGSTVIDFQLVTGPNEPAPGPFSEDREELEDDRTDPFDILEVSDAEPAPPREPTDSFMLSLRRQKLVVAAILAGLALVVVGGVALVALFSTGTAPEMPAESDEVVVTKAPSSKVRWDEAGGAGDLRCLQAGECPPASEAAEKAPPPVGSGLAASDAVEAKRVRDVLAGGRRGLAVTPRVKIDDPIVPEDGRLSQEAVQRVVSRSVSAVRHCVEREAGRSAPRGRHLLHVVVRPAGSVASSRLEGGLGGTPLGDCITRAARRWRFPPFAGTSAEVSLPLVLAAF